LNGSGYPNGLLSEEILLEAKIISVADVFEALTASDRPYRTPVGMEKALEILFAEAQAGHLDRLVVDTLATLVTSNQQWWNTLIAPLPGTKPKTGAKLLFEEEQV
jgi:HD-GYP domain-containing protein (c-di-GMP phosphodiesterase class II)